MNDAHIAGEIEGTDLSEYEGTYETETYGVTDSLDDWYLSRLKMNGFSGWWAAVKYIIHNFNVVKCQLTPSAIDNGKVILAKSIRLENIEDLSDYLSSDEEIYLYNVYQIPDDYEFDKEANELRRVERNKYWVVRYSMATPAE